MSDLNLTPVSLDFDVEYRIEESLFRFFKKVFEKDSQFRYNENEKSTHLIVTTEYPSVQETSTSFVPHLVITGISTSVNPQMTLHGNFFRDVFDEEGVLRYEERLYVWPFTVSLSCLGAEMSHSKDLANRVMRYLSMSYFFRASDYENLNISSEIGKSQTVLRQQFPSKIFESVVSFRGQKQVIGRIPHMDHLIDRGSPTLMEELDFDYEINSGI